MEYSKTHYKITVGKPITWIPAKNCRVWSYVMYSGQTEHTVRSKHNLYSKSTSTFVRFLKLYRWVCACLVNTERQIQAIVGLFNYLHFIVSTYNVLNILDIHFTVINLQKNSTNINRRYFLLLTK